MDGFTSPKADLIPGLSSAASKCVSDYAQKIEDEYGLLRIGIEYEFFIHGIDPEDENKIIDIITQTFKSEPYQKQYGRYFQKIYREFPLMRFSDNSSQGIHIPGVMKFELVIDHNTPDNGRDNFVQKACALDEMMDIIDEILRQNFPKKEITIDTGPRPIPDIYAYLRSHSSKTEREILSSIQSQTNTLGNLRPDLKTIIDSATSLETLLLDKNAIFDNEGAAGNGVDLNISILDKDNKNLFLNPESLHEGTRLFWNAAKGVIASTSTSILPYTFSQASWNRLGKSNLSAPGMAGISQSKKLGGIGKLTWPSPATGKIIRLGNEISHNDGMHMEIRHGDPGHRTHGASHTLIYLAGVLGSMYHGMQENQIKSYQSLLKEKHPLCKTYNDAVIGFNDSKLWEKILGQELVKKITKAAEYSARKNVNKSWIKTTSYTPYKNGKGVVTMAKYSEVGKKPDKVFSQEIG